MSPETVERKALEGEAADWLAALDAGTADPAAFEAWRSADPLRAAAFLRAVALWEALDRAKLGAPADSVMQLAEPVEDAAPPRHSRRNILRGAAAGSVALIAGSGFFATRGFAKTAKTQIGERRLVRLDDGTGIELNTDSSIAWRTDGPRRDVTLDRGEATLTVVAVPSGSCHLVAGNCSAELSAGQFNARLTDSGLNLVVIKGVAVVRQNGAAKPNGVVQLAAGESASFGTATVDRRRLSDDDIAAISAWQQGEIVFQGQTLDQAVAEYNRYLSRKIVLASPRLAQLRLAGRFLTDDPGVFLKALHVDFGVTATDGDQGIVLTL